jgi:NAD(P)H-dependent FMN reductase
VDLYVKIHGTLNFSKLLLLLQATQNSFKRAFTSRLQIGQSISRPLFPHGSADDRLPVYNGDLEANVPAPVLEFKKTIAAADGIIIVTPEYNYSYIAGFCPVK